MIFVCGVGSLFLYVDDLTLNDMALILGVDIDVDVSI
jgi:hypothetical protein